MVTSFHYELHQIGPQVLAGLLIWPRTMAADVEFWNTFDPSVVEGSRETRLDAYRQVRDQLMRRILQRFPLPGAPRV